MFSDQLLASVIHGQYSHHMQKIPSLYHNLYVMQADCGSNLI